MSWFVNDQFSDVGFTHRLMGQLSWSEGNVVGKGIRSIVGVKALTVRIVSVLLRDGTVVDESLHGALLPTIEEVDVPILVVPVAQ